MTAAETVRAIRDFIAIYDRTDADDRAIAASIRDRLQRELYRREREDYPELIDIGGQG